MHTITRTSELYKSFADRLTGIVEADSDPAIDGTYSYANYYSPRMDDPVFDAVREVACLHLAGKRVQSSQRFTTLQFLSRLRCVESLSDYLILAIQTVLEGQSLGTADWTRPDSLETNDETGFLDGEYSIPGY